MKVEDAVILAGGYGTRMLEYTDSMPKPLLLVGGVPIIQHLVNIFKKFGVSRILIAAGYRKEYLYGYFIMEGYKAEILDNGVKVTQDGIEILVLDTGESTQTGGRLLRMKEYLTSPFYMTYGDSLSNVCLYDVVRQFESVPDCLGVITTIETRSRFGIVESEDRKITSFSEKPVDRDRRINGGYSVYSPKIFDYISGDSSVFEIDVIPSMVGRLYEYRHDGFWVCMDTKNDLQNVNKLYEVDGAVWLKYW